MRCAIWNHYNNTQIYNFSSGPYLTRFFAVVAKKLKHFE